MTIFNEHNSTINREPALESVACWKYQHVSALEAHSHTALLHGGVRTDEHSRLEYECCDPSKYMRCAPLPCKQGLLNAVKWLSDSGRGRVPNFSVQPSRPLLSCENSQTLRCNSNEFPLLSAQLCSLLLLAC